MEKVRILFLAANPKETGQLRLSEEIRMISERIQSAKFRDNIDLEQYWAVRETDLSEALLRHRPHIVHFAGHGSESGEIILENKFGKLQPVSAQALSELFGILSDKIRCVVLNACFTEIQAKAIAQHIECVIGMPTDIYDSSALAFAGGFYRGIAYGRDILTSFKLGSNEADISNPKGKVIPQLLSMNGISPEDISFGERNLNLIKQKGNRQLDRSDEIKKITHKGESVCVLPDTGYFRWLYDDAFLPIMKGFGFNPNPFWYSYKLDVEKLLSPMVSALTGANLAIIDLSGLAFERVVGAIASHHGINLSEIIFVGKRKYNFLDVNCHQYRNEKELMSYLRSKIGKRGFCHSDKKIIE